MDRGETVKQNQPDQAGPKPERVQYEKPAIAWEEPFQQVVAANCALAVFGECGPTPGS